MILPWEECILAMPSLFVCPFILWFTQQFPLAFLGTLHLIWKPYSQDISKLFGGLLSKIWPLLVMTPPPSYATCRYSGSNPSSLFHNSVKGKVIHPHGNSLGDFALNEKSGALMVGFQVSTDLFILVWLWGWAPQGLWAGDHSGL